MTSLSIQDGRWCLNGAATHPGTRAEGLLMNVRMVNAVCEDRNPQTCPAGSACQHSWISVVTGRPVRWRTVSSVFMPS